MDLYGVLGLNKNASVDDIKKSYRQLAKKWHPDKNQGSKQAEEKFKSISQAYEILSDPNKKKEYDRRLNSNKGFKFSFDDFVNNFSGSDFNDWRKRSNTRSRPSQPKPSSEHLDITVDHVISIRDAFSGNKVEVSFTRRKISYDDLHNYFLENEEKTIAFELDLKKTVLSIKEENGIYSTVVRLGKLGHEEMYSMLNLWGEAEPVPVMGDALIKILFKMEPKVSIEDKNLIHRIEVPFVNAIIENEKIKVEAVNGKKYEASLNYPKNLSKIEFSIPNEGLAISKTERGKYVVRIEVILPLIEEMDPEIKSKIKSLLEPIKE